MGFNIIAPYVECTCVTHQYICASVILYLCKSKLRQPKSVMRERGRFLHFFSQIFTFRLIISKPARNRCTVVIVYYTFMQQIMFLVICPKNIPKTFKIFHKDMWSVLSFHIWPPYLSILSLKVTSGGPRHCIWTPGRTLKFSCYLALDPPKGIHIVKSR